MSRYTQAAGRVVREPVVESTPALEIELLTRIALKGGAASLRNLFDRCDDSWPSPAPTWAVLAKDALVAAELVVADLSLTQKLIITEAGWLRVGRRRIPGISQ